MARLLDGRKQEALNETTRSKQCPPTNSTMQCYDTSGRTGLTQQCRITNSDSFQVAMLDKPTSYERSISRRQQNGHDRVLCRYSRNYIYRRNCFRNRRTPTHGSTSSFVLGCQSTNGVSLG